MISPHRHPSPADDESDEVARWPDTSPAGSRPSSDTSHNGGPAGPRQHWHLPATGRSVTVLRRALDAFLREAQLSDDERDDLLLAACEAASNAIEHPRNPTEPFFEVLAELGDGRVTIVVCDHGQWRDAPAGTHRGRGLRMMWLLADTTVAAGRLGTTVTIRSSPRHGRHPATPDGERGTGGEGVHPSAAVGGG
ncbi:ATP-binding protein [Trujillonella humicola]|uniref:ATP-binding protein n=1 Tax=Trujillonella humicola TaxID=3383699 RepID=UPI0039059726